MMMWPLPDDANFHHPHRHTYRQDDPDTTLAFEVVRRMSADQLVRRQRITVEVQNRVVLLCGLVDSASAHRAAVWLARDVPGVRDVCDGLRRLEPDGHARPFSPAPSDRYDACSLEEIMAALQADEPDLARPPRRARRALGVVLGFVLGVVGTLASMLMVIAGATPVLIAGAVVVVVVAIAYRLTVRTGDRHRDARSIT